MDEGRGGDRPCSRTGRERALQQGAWSEHRGWSGGQGLIILEGSSDSPTAVGTPGGPCAWLLGLGRYLRLPVENRLQGNVLVFCSHTLSGLKQYIFYLPVLEAGGPQSKGSAGLSPSGGSRRLCDLPFLVSRGAASKHPGSSGGPSTDNPGLPPLNLIPPEDVGAFCYVWFCHTK